MTTLAAMTLNDGWDVFLAAVLLMFVGLIVSSYTSGGITRRPYNKIYGGAPGARRSPRIAGRSPGDGTPVRRRGTR